MSDNSHEETVSQPNPANADACPTGCRIVPAIYDPIEKRADAARDLRIQRANILRNQPLPQEPLCNGDEETHTGENAFIAMYSKGLAHDPKCGQVTEAAYCALLRGLQQKTVKDFDHEVGPHLGCVPVLPGTAVAAKTLTLKQVSPETSAMGEQMRLINPLSAQAFELMGIDSHQVQLFDWGNFDSDNNVGRINFPPPPRFDSEEVISEMAEVYWMALCRDIPFRHYDTNAVTKQAACDLVNFGYGKDYPSPPKVDAANPSTHIRGFTKGDEVGPYVSQFLVRPVLLAATTIDPRIRTLRPVRDQNGKASEGKPNEYLASFEEWLARQNGCRPDIPQSDTLVKKPVLAMTGRDLGQYVHVDIPLEEFLNACFIITTPHDPTAPAPEGLTVPLNSNGDNLIGGGMSDDTGYNLFSDGNPYKPSHKPQQAGDHGSQVQDGFGTLGKPDLKVLIAEAALRGFRAAWYQKWSIHRRLRPEEFGGRIEVQLNRGKAYPFHPSFSTLNNTVLKEINAYNKQYLGQDTYLLPQAYLEGCPLHPSYPQGHATVAGACVTILKAFTKNANFVEENITIVEPVDGQTLKKYQGTDEDKITLHGELNKLASNVGLARDFVGVHYRSDYTNGLRLGETVAIWMLCDIRKTYAEDFTFEFSTFDGHHITIDKDFCGCFQVSPNAEGTQQL